MADPNVLRVIDRIRDRSPEQVHYVDFAGLVTRARVRNKSIGLVGHRPAKVKVGEVVAELPAMVAETLRGPHDERDVLVLVHVRREVYDEARRFVESGLVLPDGVRM